MKMDTIKQRRSRKATAGQSHQQSNTEEEDDDEVAVCTKFSRGASFYYKLRVQKPEDVCEEISVCRHAFMSIHGISRGRLRHIQSSLMNSGMAPLERRGKHVSRPNQTPTQVVSLVEDHIRSFKPRQSHYSLRHNPHATYLPETLSVKQMHALFLDTYRIAVPYKVYWTIFTSKFNIRFGVPRSDTCTMCDELLQKLNACSNEDEKRHLNIQKELHLRKAEAFYSLKRKWKRKAREGKATVLSFDFMQNLPLPHLQTNAVFFARQLWYYVFGVHDLSNDDVSLYVYHECVGKKGQNDVTSLLFHYLHSKSDDLEDDLVLISDGCSGQNKNYAMVHFLYMLVHCFKMFQRITYIFPIRGHSYLPNDQDFSIVEKKKRKATIETPEEWDNLLRSCRSKPSPFNVVNVDQSDLCNIKEAVQPFFLKNPRPAVKLKPARMFRITQEHQFLEIRDTYNGPWRSCMIRNLHKLPTELVLQKLYPGPLPLNSGKRKDLRNLYSVLKPSSVMFYNSLGGPELDTAGVESEVDLDMSDNSSGGDG